MLILIAFWGFLGSAVLLILIAGDYPARTFLGLVVLATVLTAATDMSAVPAVAPFAYLAIDGGLLAIGCAYVCYVKRFWPIWFTGFQVITVASEIARLAWAGPIPIMYARVAGFWAIPALLTMAVGVFLDRRAVVRKRGTNA